jgi:hypothetical protein
MNNVISISAFINKVYELKLCYLRNNDNEDIAVIVDLICV